MSKKKFFIVLTCCLLVATFCVSFAGAPQVQSAPADIRAVLDRPDCASAPLIVPPVVEPPLMDFVVPDSMVGTWYVNIYYASSIDVIYIIQDLYSGAPDLYFTVIYEDVVYDTVYGVGLTDAPFFSYHVDGQDFTVEVGYSFYIVIDSLDVLLYDDEDMLVDSETVITDFPDGFLTRVNESPSGVEIVGSIVDILMSGLIATGEAMGEAFSVLAESIFINADGTGLSTFGVLIVVFSSVSLGLSLTRWVLNFCSSWGKRNR